jgi:hypothetical protein
MTNQQVFCSACDREVRVLITDAPTMEGQATAHDEEVVCLEIGERCTGNLCPISAAAPASMVGRILRNGLPLEGMKTVRSVCPACGLESEMVLYGAGRATCTSCGTSVRWVAQHAEPM